MVHIHHQFWWSNLSFLSYFYINPYFCHIFVKPGPFCRRDTEPGTIEWCWWSLLHYTFHLLSFHLLFFCPIVLKWHFWHLGQWFDGSPNLGSSFWMIHYDLQPVTCQLPPATWYLWHLWRQKQVVTQRPSELHQILLLSTSWGRELLQETMMI